jgi:tetratricopeptide (TPR) repeat protein
MRRYLSWATVAVAWLVAGGALAQDTRSDDQRARDHFGAGRAYYEQARYEDAAREFSEAYRLSPRPELLHNISQAYERALMFDDAIAALQRLLDRHPHYPDQATVRERIANLERLRDRVRGGGGGDEDAGEEDAAPAPTRAASTGGGASTSSGGGGGGGGGISIPGIALLAGGGAVGLVSIITGAVSHDMFESLQTDCPSGVCPADRQGDIDTGNALALTSTITMFVSIAALGAGVVLLIVDSGGDDGESARLEVRPNGLALVGEFQ